MSPPIVLRWVAKSRPAKIKNGDFHEKICLLFCIIIKFAGALQESPRAVLYEVVTSGPDKTKTGVHLGGLSRGL